MFHETATGWPRPREQRGGEKDVSAIIRKGQEKISDSIVSTFQLQLFRSVLFQHR